MAKSVVRLGVVGLGSRWHKSYKASLSVLRERFQILAVVDQVRALAEREAKTLKCTATSVTELLHSPLIDAVLLTETQWHGIWPVTLAWRCAKPVLWINPTTKELLHLQPLLSSSTTESNIGVAEPLFCAPVLEQLLWVQQTHVGPIQTLTLTHEIAAQTTKKAARWAPLLALGTLLLNAKPERLRLTHFAQPEATLTVACEGGRWLHVTQRLTTASKPTYRLHAGAADGNVSAVWPNRLRWTDAAGSWSHTVPTDPVGRLTILAQFHQAIQQCRVLQPSLRDMVQAHHWLHLAQAPENQDRWLTV